MNSAPTSIAVSIVDDDEAFSQCIRLLVDGNPGMSCVSHYPDGPAAIAGLPNDRPAVALIDLQIPGQTGIEVIRELRPKMPNTLFVVLTSHSDDERVFESLKAGATGYLLKRSAPVAILSAISEAHSGGSPMSTYIARRVVESFSPSLKVSQTPREQIDISKREEEILTLLAQSFLYKEIATELEISLDTVRSHIRRIYEKLQVHSRTEAVVKFLKR